MARFVTRTLQTLLRCGFSGSRPCSKWDKLNRHLNHAKFYSLYEPANLDDPPEIPEYDTLQIKMRGYDYAVLESYSKYVHNLVMKLGLENNSFAVPARTNRVDNLKPHSSVVDRTYDLAVYERIVQIEELPSTMAPILFEVLQQNLPEGVHFTVKEPEEEEEEFRYVPNIMLMALQKELEEIGSGKQKKRKRGVDIKQIALQALFQASDK